MTSLDIYEMGIDIDTFVRQYWLPSKIYQQIYPSWQNPETSSLNKVAAMCDAVPTVYKSSWFFT